MSGPQPGFLATYNSLTDKHLVGYFSNTRIRRHLQRSGLISRSGRIIPEKEYRLNAMRRDHQRYLQECLARAISLKVLDMEHHHQLEMKRKLESSVRKERLQKFKVEQSRRLVEDASPVLCPHPPLGPRTQYGLRPLVAAGPAGPPRPRALAPRLDHHGGHPSHLHRSREPAFSKTPSWRPNTAPGNMQRPLRLQPLRSCAAVESVPKTSSSKQKWHALEHHQQFASGGDKSGLRLVNSIEYVTGRSLYQLPVISNDVPPPPLQKEGKSVNAVRNGMPRVRRFRPTTAPNDAEQLLTKNSGGFSKPSLRSNAFVTMIFLGKSVHLSHDDADYRDEIKVYQQHCGGGNLCVYKGKLLEGETFQFISRRHHGFPFSLTFFLNGMQVDRLSCCCEYKHQKRSRLGGRHGYFGFVNVEGASPCYRCIIAMGLDRKPSPPKRKMEEDHEEELMGSWGDGVSSEPSKSSVEQKSSKNSVLVILPGHEASMENTEDKTETRQEYRKEERKKLSEHESEGSQEDTSKYEYDEDFEADEEVNEEGQTGDQMNGMSKSSSDDKKHNLDYEKESKISSQKALQASDSEKDESDGYSDSDSEDDKQGELSKGNTAVCEKVAAARKIQSFYRKYKIHQKLKSDGRSARSLSSISTQGSSEDDSRAETMEDNGEGEEEYNIDRTSDYTACAQYGSGNEENKLLRKEENQEAYALEKEGMDEAEKANPEALAIKEDTRIFQENMMAVQHQSPEVNGEQKQAGSAEGDREEDGEKNASSRQDDREEDLVPLENNTMGVENSNEESPQSDRGGVFEARKPVQEEIAKASGSDLLVNCEPEPRDSSADEQENVTSTECDASEAPDGAFLAGGTRTLDVQKAAEQVVREGQMVGERQAPEKEDSVAEGGDGRTEEAGEELARVGDLLPEEDGAAVLRAEGQPAVGDSAPGQGVVAEEDPIGKGTGEGMESGAEVSPREKDVLMEGTGREAALGAQTPGAEELAGAPLGREAGRAVSEGQEVAGEVSKGEEAVEDISEAKGGAGPAGEAGPPVKEMGEMVPEAEEAVEEGGFKGKGVVAGAVAEREEAVGGASLSEEGVSRVLVSEGEESAEEAVSEGEKAVERPGALLEAGDMNICTEAAVPEGEDFVKLNEFSQLNASGQEWLEMGKAATGAATSETGEASEVDGSAFLRAEDAVEGSVELGEGPVLQGTPQLESLVGAGGDPVSEGSSQLEETTTAEEEEDAAEVLSSGNSDLGSKEKTGSAREEEPAGGVLGVCAEIARAESGGGEGVTGGAAGTRELAAGMEGLWERAGESGNERPPGEARVAGASLPTPGLCRGEVGVVAVAVVGAQVGWGAQVGTPVLEGQEMAAEGRVGNCRAPQEGRTGAVWGTQGGMEAVAAEGVSAEGRGAAGESVRGEEGVAVSPGHGELRGAMSLREQPIAAHGDGGAEPGESGSTGSEGLFPDTQPAWAAPGAAAGKVGLGERTEQVGMKAEGEQPGLGEDVREKEAAPVLESAQNPSGAAGPGKGQPWWREPQHPGSRGRGREEPWGREDVVNPDAAVVPSVQPQDGGETCL